MNNATKYIYNLLNDNDKEITWIENNLNITLNSQQKEYINHISEHDNSIILTKRRLGSSTANICWNIYNCFNEEKASCLIVCISPKMSFNVCKSILTNANIKVNSSNYKIKFENNNQIHFITPQSIAGCMATHLSVDDVNNLKQITPLFRFSKKNAINFTKENNDYYQMYLNSFDPKSCFNPLNLTN